MARNLKDARLKINRANEHLRNIKLRIARLENSYSAVIEFHPKFGYKTIKYDLADDSAIEDVSLLIGDTLHNLKCALDYAWIKVLENNAPDAITDKTQFPIHPTLQALENSFTNAKKKLPTILTQLLLTKIKPYLGGNDALCDVKRLNIMDKHRLLLPVITYTGIAGLEMEDESGESMKGFGTSTMQQPPWYIRISDGWNVKDKGKPSIDILFDEGAPTNFHNVTAALEYYSLMILQVVETLEAFA